MQSPEQLRIRDDRPGVGTEQLVGGTGVEVGAERRDVGGRVRGRMDAIDVRQRANRVGTIRDRADVGSGSDQVRRRRHRDEPRALADHTVEDLGGKLTRGRVDFGPANLRAGAPRRPHRRPDVGVLVQRGDHDLVAGPPLAGQRVGDVERQRGHVRAEHHSVRRAADQIGDRPARCRHGLDAARALRERAAEV
jgi:hypothetical protein